MKNIVKLVFDKISNEIMNDSNKTASSRYVDTRLAMYDFKNEIISMDKNINEGNYIVKFNLGTNQDDNGTFEDSVLALVYIDENDTIISVTNNKTEFLQNHIFCKNNTLVSEKWNYNEKINNILVTSGFKILSEDGKENFKNEISSVFFKNSLAKLINPEKKQILAIESELEKYVESTKNNLEQYEYKKEENVSSNEIKNKAWEKPTNEEIEAFDNKWE